MLFEKINKNDNQGIGTLTIVCCSGSSCKDGQSGTSYDNSKGKSSDLHGPKHSSGGNSCTS